MRVCLDLGMIHAGVGETHLNNILSTIDIPPVSHKTLKKAEREIGRALEQTAKASCLTHLEKERQLTLNTSQPSMVSSLRSTPDSSLTSQPTSDLLEGTPTSSLIVGLSPAPTTPTVCHATSFSIANDPPSSQTLAEISPETLQLYQRRLSEGYDLTIDLQYNAWKAAQQLSVAAIASTPTETPAEGEGDEDTADSYIAGLTVSYDMGWPKRGRAMNSTSGHGAIIGSHSGKVLGYATRHKRCIVCSVAEANKRPTREHDCRRNHTGSSKSMEPAVALNLAREMEKHDARIACLVSCLVSNSNA